MRHVYPRELIKKLEALGNTVTEAYPGIYYVEGNVTFPTQIIVGAQLDRELHRVFKVLTNNIKEEDAKAFLSEAAELRSKLPNSNIADIISSVLQASMTSNEELYSQIRGNKQMRDVLMEFLGDEIAERERLAVDKATKAANERADANAAEAKANAARADKAEARAEQAEARVNKVEARLKDMEELLKKMGVQVAAL